MEVKRLKTLAFNVKNSDGNNVLHRLVLNHSEPNESGNEAYIFAILRLMSDITDVNTLNKEGFSALHLAVLKNNLLMVKKLLFHLCNINVNAISLNYSGETALHLAAKMGHSSIIQELLNVHAYVDMRNNFFNTPLNLARDLDTIKLLVNNGARVNTIGIEGSDKEDYPQICAPLHLAAERGDLEAVKFLIESGANVNYMDGKRRTPIIRAAFQGKSECVKYLIKHGACLYPFSLPFIPELIRALWNSYWAPWKSYLARWNSYCETWSFYWEAWNYYWATWKSYWALVQM